MSHKAERLLSMDFLTDEEVRLVEEVIRGESPDIPDLSAEKLQRGGYLIWQDAGPRPTAHAMTALGHEAARRG